MTHTPFSRKFQPFHPLQPGAQGHQGPFKLRLVIGAPLAAIEERPSLGPQ